MSAHLAYAEGSPCPTLVLDSQRLPRDNDDLLRDLSAVRAELTTAGSAHVLKNALVRPSAHPMFDLDYRFVQSLPAGYDQFDLRGSCGHSILSAVVAASRYGMIPHLAAGQRIRVNVLNNDDNVVCEVDETSTDETVFTAHFLCAPHTPVSGLLMTGHPVTEVALGALTVPVSLVSMGNPYIFVSARHLGVETREELFADDPVLFQQMSQLRRAVCALLGWDPAGAFPKIAALLAGDAGTVAARAISVPSWHPTLALTGAICLGAAIRIQGTVPSTLVESPDGGTGMVRIETPGGAVQVLARTTNAAADPELGWVSVGGKKVTYQGTLALPVLPSTAADPTTATDSSITDKERTWLPMPV